jgi:hypothetical protein
VFQLRNPDIRAIFDIVTDHLDLDEQPTDLCRTVGSILSDFFSDRPDKPFLDQLPEPLLDALEPHFANLIEDIRDIHPDLNG